MGVHHVNSSPIVTGSGGLRLLNKAALPFTREMESRWKSLWMVVLSSSPVCLARALPSFFSSAMAEGCQAPRHSTAKGRNSMPWRWQASQDLSSFLRWASPAGRCALRAKHSSWHGPPAHRWPGHMQDKDQQRRRWGGPVGGGVRRQILVVGGEGQDPGKVLP